MKRTTSCDGRPGCRMAGDIAFLGLRPARRKTSDLPVFLDGGPPPVPDSTSPNICNITQRINSPTKMGMGDRLFPGSDPSLNVVVSLSQFIYQSDQKISWAGNGVWT